MSAIIKILVLAAVIPLAGYAGGQESLISAPRPDSLRQPNIIYILCDDLGIGDLGCYGQTKIRTPNIDQLAAEGMRFTRHYCGSAVCAPSRCTLMTGLHTGHAFVRDNFEVPNADGQLPLPAGTITVAKLLQQNGYATAIIGKWGLGNPDSDGAPLKQGFDHSFGPNCQRVAHSYYPAYTWCDDKIIPLNQGCSVSTDGRVRIAPNDDSNNPASYRQFIGKDYVPDLLEKDAIHWIKANKDKPFFLYYPTPVPHAALQVPEDSVAEYKDKLDDKPYLGNRGYVPCRYPRATYAAMITRMDRSIGRILQTVKELGLDDNTVIMFCSDNGPSVEGGVDPAYFKSALGLRDLKGALYEGGIRAPFIARWPGKIKPGTTSDYLSAMWDILPTACELAHIQPPANADGLSLLPTLLALPDQKKHDYLYWEFDNKRAIVTADGWKGIKFHPSLKFELYDLKDDPSEKKNVANDHPELAAKIQKMMDEAHTDSTEFPLAGPTQKK